MSLDAAAAVHAPVWTVIDYESEVLAHRITLAQALKIVLDMLASINDWDGTGQYWPLFMVAPAPLGGAGWRAIAGGLHRVDSPDDRARARGITIDVRDLVAGVPALDIGGAAENIYAPFRSIDLCSGAYRDMPLLFDWPADRVNDMQEFDAALERQVCARFAAELAAGTPVSVVFERTRLSHVDELHLWVFQQLFDFHASAPGLYKEPDQVYGFESSHFSRHVVLAWGCMPHAHEMAWGIAYGIEVDLPVDPETHFAPREPMVRLEPRFVAQIGALLAARPADWRAMDSEDVALMLAELEEDRRSDEARDALLKAAERRRAAKVKSAKKQAAKRKAARKAGSKKTSAKTASKPAKRTAAKQSAGKKAAAKQTAKKSVGKKTAGKQAAGKKSAGKKTAKGAPKQTASRSIVAR